MHAIFSGRPAYFDMIYRYQLCYLDISILIHIDIDINFCRLSGYQDGYPFK